MRIATYDMHFDGEELDVRVGDKVSFAGIGTVQKIGGELIDVTSLGSDPEFMLGNVTVALVANGARVEKV